MASAVDIVVVGAGLVGAAAALGLAQKGYSVVVFERRKPEIQHGKLGVDIRNVALSPASQSLLDSIDVWRSVSGAVPYRQMCVWEERGTKSMDFRASSVDRDELGWILEQSPLATLLWNHLEAEPNVELLLDAPLLDIQTDSDVVKIVTKDNEVETRLLLGADGARSTVREILGVPSERVETGHHALASVVRTELPHENVAYQRFLRTGPLALLPGAEANLSSVVWSQPPELAARRQALSESEFCEELAQSLDFRLGAVKMVDERSVFPLEQMLVQSFNPHPRVLLIGDAARILHPLAGLGVNLGFEDVRDVLQQLAGPPSNDPGTTGMWRQFARRRRARSQLLIGLMTAFRRIYAASDPFLQWARNAGVGWLDNATTVKAQLIKEALGLGSVAERL